MRCLSLEVGLAVTMCLFWLVPVVLAVQQDSKSVPLPKGAREREQPMKPANGFSHYGVLLVGDKVVGWREYYDNKILFEEKLYKDYENRVLHGLHRTWHRNGKPWQEHAYQDGKLHGRYRSWDQQGKLLVESKMIEGTGVLKTYHSNGKPAYETPYLDGKKHGVSRQWYKNGSLFADTAYDKGKIEGRGRSYHPSGRPKSEFTYRDGKAHGIHRCWNEAGKLVNWYGLFAKDTPADYGDPKESPYYYVHGKQVTREQFEEAAKSDAALRRLIKAGP